MEEIEQQAPVAEEETAEAEVIEEAKDEAPAAREPKENKEPRERGDRPAKKGFKGKSFKKVCVFCQDKTTIDYKDVAKLRKFVAEGGKILPRRMTGTCAQHQRAVAKAIKRARVAALLPFKAD